ncbi:MAG TPA: Ni/Fe-hydrogenase cytochrome b subunit [Candidatus Polarisedimenticolaceae bacterium]
MSHAHSAAPVGGTIWTRPFKVLFAIFVLGMAFTAWRFAVGIGPVSGLSDGYPWGIWIAFDVVTGTALACGGYAVALLAYILNKGKYHPLVRPAVLTSALGYTLAGMSIAIDVGRPWWMWKIPLQFWSWNLNSALLEVALCVMAYIVVLWIELAPAFLETWKKNNWMGLASLSEKLLPVLDRALPFILALGLLLPTMHQSSLGTVMLLTGHKLHPLWNSPFLPLLFLLGCISMGYAVVVWESTLSSWLLKRPSEQGILADLAKAVVPFSVVFLVIRWADLAWRGALGSAFQPNLLAFMFWVEHLLLIASCVMVLSRRAATDRGFLFQAAMLMMLAGGVYRFDAYIIGFNPGDNWAYFPAAPELLITVGLVALEILGYVVIIKLFPILSGAPKAPARG